MNGLARADPAKQDADRVRFRAPPVDAPDELAPAQSLGAALGVTALSAGIAGWVRVRATPLERMLLIASAVLLFFPQPQIMVSGAILAALTATLHWRRPSTSV